MTPMERLPSFPAVSLLERLAGKNFSLPKGRILGHVHDSDYFFGATSIFSLIFPVGREKRATAVPPAIPARGAVGGRRRRASRGPGSWRRAVPSSAAP